MDSDLWQKPLRQLRKQIKRLPDELTPDEIHRLRIHIRRVQSVLAVIAAPGSKSARQLIKSIDSLSKICGRVRDLDVAQTNASVLQAFVPERSLAKLCRRLSKQRKRAASKLAELLKRKGNSLRSALKTQTDRMEKKVPAGERAAVALVPANGRPRQLRRLADSITQKLSAWPEPSGENLHTFRLQVKSLRSLNYYQSAADPILDHQLHCVALEIGSWHDWAYLAALAHELLNEEKDAELLAHVDGYLKDKLTDAQEAARSLRVSLQKKKSSHRRSKGASSQKKLHRA
ncbi:MAG: CHAD domain-containing protein [Terracidiphilus sp.]|nr:CHAD domain-containing protein [Terracidiphilus sp.]